MLKRVFSSFLDPVAGHSQSVSLISSSSFSTPHFPISSSPRGKPHIIGPHTSLSLHQYPSAFSRSTRLPSHLPSLSPTKFPPAKCQDLNQASRGKHLDHTSSHAKLLLLFLSSSLLCYSFKLKAPYCCAPPDPSSLKHSETRQRKQEPRLKQLCYPIQADCHPGVVWPGLPIHKCKAASLCANIPSCRGMGNIPCSLLEKTASTILFNFPLFIKKFVGNKFYIK